MNIVFLDQFGVLGGAQQCLLDLLPAVRERGWNARAVIPRDGPLARLSREAGIEVDEVRCGPYGSGRKSAGDLMRFAADFPAQRAAIERLLDSAPTDLVYVNGPRMLIPAAFATRRRFPILFHAHHCVSQPSAAYLQGVALRQSSAIVVACCEAVARPLRRWVPPERVHVIANGTPDFGFRIRRPDQTLRIGVIGRISPEKGQAEFLRAAMLVGKCLPEARFVICGSPLFGGQDYYKEVLHLAEDLPVELLEWQENAAAILHDLDVLVIPSRQEGMPRVLLEAFSAGVPVVAFPVGGIPEVIRDGVTGFLARNSSPESLAAKLVEVMESDTSRLDDVTRWARCQWEGRYTLQAYRSAITNLMEQCVRSAGRETGLPQPRKPGTRPSAPTDIRSA